MLLGSCGVFLLLVPSRPVASLSLHNGRQSSGVRASSEVREVLNQNVIPSQPAPHEARVKDLCEDRKHATECADFVGAVETCLNKNHLQRSATAGCVSEHTRPCEDICLCTLEMVARGECSQKEYRHDRDNQETDSCMTSCKKAKSGLTTCFEGIYFDPDYADSPGHCKHLVGLYLRAYDLPHGGASGAATFFVETESGVALLTPRQARSAGAAEEEERDTVQLEPADPLSFMQILTKVSDMILSRLRGSGAKGATVAAKGGVRSVKENSGFFSLPTRGFCGACCIEDCKKGTEHHSFMECMDLCSGENPKWGWINPAQLAAR